MIFLNKQLDKDFILAFSEFEAIEKLTKILEKLKKPKIIKKPRSKLSVK